MRRIRLVLAVASMALLLVAFAAAPAMAMGNGNDNHNNGNKDNDHHALVRSNDADNDDFGGFAFDNENELESGPVDLDFSVRNTGDYASQCVPATQFGNSGNFNNAPTFAQFGSDGGIDDFEPGGIDFSASPEVAVDCSSTIGQSSAADSSGYWGY